jgi:hypothetical protein
MGNYNVRAKFIIYILKANKLAFGNAHIIYANILQASSLEKGL